VVTARSADGPVRAFVQTRGTARATDYAFLGGAPPRPWWRAYRDTTAFDHPTVLVTSDGREWAAYLSGIPSARVDAVGTVVRYTLVLDGPCGAAHTACVPAAVAAWLDDVADGLSGRSGLRLPAALDARFPPDDVQRWLAAAAPDGPVAAEVRRRALAALAALPDPGPGGPPADGPGDWWAAVTAPAARAAFVARVAALLGGVPGRALLLNLVGGPDDAAALLDPASPLALLVEGGPPARPTPLRPVVDAKKAPAATALPRPARRAGVAVLGSAVVLPLAAAVVLAVLVVTALVVTVLVLLL
jgi:hypothetical protein